MEEFSPRARTTGLLAGALGVVELSGNKIQRLFAAVVEACVGETAYRLRWSRWRRQHQARARSVTTGGNPPSNHEDHDLRLEY
jgi:hypothetical protein